MTEVDKEIKIIDKLISALDKVIKEKEDKWDYSRPYSDFQDYMEVEFSERAKLDMRKRFIMPYEFHAIPDYAYTMTIAEFVKACKDGWFIDYDGSGYYTKDGKETNVYICPSDVIAGSVRDDMDGVAWYNR